MRGRVLGIEPTGERVEAARELAGKRLDPGRLEFREGDATALSLQDRSLDWVWCGDVLHHILDTDKALSEFRRVVRSGGRVVIKESQVLSAMFLPGHPELERHIQLAEIARSLDEGGGRSFQERRQTTLASLRAAGLTDVAGRSYLIERRAPLTAATREYIQKTVFDRNWGERLRPLLSAEDWTLRSAVCERDSPRNALASPDYYCLYPITVFNARRIVEGGLHGPFETWRCPSALRYHEGLPEERCNGRPAPARLGRFAETALTNFFAFTERRA